MASRQPFWVVAALACGLSTGAISPPAPASADPLAVIAAARGKVDVLPAKGGKPQRAVFGLPLERGDKVSVGAGGAATVFFNDGNVIELAEKSAVTVGGRVAPPKRASGASGLREVFTQVSRFVTAGSRGSGLVSLSGMRGGTNETPLLLEPRQTDVLEARPSFAWRAIEGAARYRLTVSNERGTLWTREVSATTCAYPDEAAALDRDADYLWEVEAFAERGSLRHEVSAFHVLARTESDAVAANLARIRGSAGGAQSPAAAFLAGSYLSGRGLYRDAADQFKNLRKLSPDSPAPHEALGKVYRAVGLMDLAAAEFQQALALTREP